MDQRFYTLDAMRGVAAIAVVILHVGITMHLRTTQYAYLAVDFFFALSGFVLARAYERKLKASLSGSQFIRLRIIRLYPLFALGVSLGTIAAVSQIATKNPHALSISAAFIAFITNIFMLPSPLTAALFPLDGPGWSLFFELVINILFGALLFGLPSRFLALLCAIAGLLLSIWILRIGSSNVIGTAWLTALPGLFRVSFSFSLGVLFARHFDLRNRFRSPLALLSIAALTALLMTGPNTNWQWLYDLTATLLIIPGILWIGAIIEIPKALERFGAVLGDISYPIYAIHVPLLQISTFILVRELHLSNTVAAVIFVVGSLLLSWVLAIRFDAPVRKWLSRRFHLKPTALPIE